MRKITATLTAIAVIGLLPTTARAITNGQPDTESDYVGAMRGFDPGGTQRQCSGSLIAPGVFLTAGHCSVLSDVTLHFGDVLDAEEDDNVVFEATEVTAHPNRAANFGFQYDVAVVVFDQGDVELPVGELAPASYVDNFTRKELKAATFTTAGYGLVRSGANGNSQPLMPSPVRMSTTQSFLNLHNQYLGLSIHTNKGNGGGCFGDSGGPHLLDGVIVSITSNGDGNCVATDNTQRVDQPEIRDWIMSFSGS